MNETSGLRKLYHARTGEKHLTSATTMCREVSMTDLLEKAEAETRELR